MRTGRLHAIQLRGDIPIGFVSCLHKRAQPEEEEPVVFVGSVVAGIAGSSSGSERQGEAGMAGQVRQLTDTTVPKWSSVMRME